MEIPEKYMQPHWDKWRARVIREWSRYTDAQLVEQLASSRIMLDMAVGGHMIELLEGDVQDLEFLIPWRANQA